MCSIFCGKTRRATGTDENLLYQQLMCFFWCFFFWCVHFNVVYVEFISASAVFSECVGRQPNQQTTDRESSVQTGRRREGRCTGSQNSWRERHDQTDSRPDRESESETEIQSVGEIVLPTKTKINRKRGYSRVRLIFLM